MTRGRLTKSKAALLLVVLQGAVLTGCTRTYGPTECPTPGFCVQALGDGGCQVRPLLCCLPNPEVSGCELATEVFVTDAGAACVEQPAVERPKCL